MAYIETIAPENATGELADLYIRVGNPDGTVDNVLTVHSLHPDTLRTHFEMYTAAMHGPSPLSRAEREMVAVVVSRLNGCRYCLQHHLAGLKRLLPEDRQRDADCLADGRITRLPEREAAITAYATKLTTNPHNMEAGDVESLRNAGLDDRAILDLAQCIGYFCYVNRIVQGLGVHVGDGEGAIGQWPHDANAPD